MDHDRLLSSGPLGLGGGWLNSIGILDFAGGTVVHVNAGMAALAAAILIGKRKGFGRYQIRPNNIPFVAIGAAMLWFGWFGFNAGSALAADKSAVLAFFNTNLAASVAALTWLLIDWIYKRAPSMIGVSSGAVAGLVSITPAAGFVGVDGAMVIGFGAGMICYLSVLLIKRRRIDDALDVFGVHGIGGVWGSLATGIFAVGSGLVYGDLSQFFVQLSSVLVVSLYSFVATLLLLKLIDSSIGLRVKPEVEEVGLDIGLHREEAYNS